VIVYLTSNQIVIGSHTELMTSIFAENVLYRIGYRIFVS